MLFRSLTGLATGLIVLTIARSGSALGKAVIDPTHNSLISDYYPIEARTKVFSVHRAANAVGSFVGPLAAGFLAFYFSWRTPFIVFAIPTIILAVIAKIGTGGGQGYVLEYRGEAIRALSMEGRMTICNMSIEAGARAGMIAPDQTTFDYIQGRERAPQGADWDAAVEYWKTLPTDQGAVFDREVVIDAATLSPFVTWGTNPGQGAPLSAIVPSPSDFSDETQKAAAAKALAYMGLEAGQPIKSIKVDTVFLGSCTNGRIEDLRAAASVLKGHKVADGVRMLVVPGSVKVRLQAIEEGLDQVFSAAGAEWREAGCSMCLAMNPDKLTPGERSASTSNRNFEGRQGPGGRTHLVSPAVAAATAIRGTLSSPADL